MCRFSIFGAWFRLRHSWFSCEAYRSVYSMVSKYIQDPHLRQLFSFHSLLVGGNPFTTTSIYTLIHCLERKWGVFFPKGGTGALVQALVKFFLDLGGEIRFNSEVSEIMTERSQVTGVVTQEGRKEVFDLGDQQCRRFSHL